MRTLPPTTHYQQVVPIIEDTHGLTRAQIMSAIPSVYATEPHASRSAKYMYISTGELLDSLANERFIPTTVMQSRSKQEGRQPFTKHLLRLRHQDDLGDDRPDVFEIIVINSHDGSTSYQLLEGIFRLVCGNGQIRGSINGSLRIQHKGNQIQEVLEGTHRIVEGSAHVMELVEEMKQVELSREEQLLLSELAMKVRFDINEEKGETLKELVPYQPANFLRTLHREDLYHNDLYTVFNKIQENMIKGGVRRRDAQGQIHTTRAVKGIERHVKINTLLWQLAEGMLSIKKHNLA